MNKHLMLLDSATKMIEADWHTSFLCNAVRDLTRFGDDDGFDIRDDLIDLIEELISPFATFNGWFATENPELDAINTYGREAWRRERLKWIADTVRPAVEEKFK